MYPMRFIEILELFIAWQFGPGWKLAIASHPALVYDRQTDDYLLAFTLVEQTDFFPELRCEKVTLRHVMGYAVDEGIIIPTTKPW